MSTIRKQPETRYDGPEGKQRSNAGRFLEDYRSFLKGRGYHPTIEELAKFSKLSLQDLEIAADHLIKNRKASYNEGGGLVLDAYKNLGHGPSIKHEANKPKAKYRTAKRETSSFKPAKSGNGNSDDILDNPFMKIYIEEILEGSDGARKIINLFGSNTTKLTDEDISKESGLLLNVTRRNLERFHEKGIFDYVMTKDDDTGFKTYFWHFKGLENLRNHYISDTQKRIKDIEEEVSSVGAKTKYVCEKFGKNHRVFDFDSDSVADSGYKCADCGKPLALTPGEDMIEPLENEIRLLRESIEEVKKIKLNGSA